MDQKERNGMSGLLAKVGCFTSLVLLTGWLGTTVGANWLVLATAEHYFEPLFWGAQCLLVGLVSMVWSSAYWAIVFNVAIWTGLISGGSLLGLGVSGAVRRREE